MANRSSEERHIRKLGKTGGGKTYMITIPIEYVRQLNWREGQKLSVIVDGDHLTVSEHRPGKRDNS